jgi:hypothetical protein
MWMFDWRGVVWLAPLLLSLWAWGIQRLGWGTMLILGLIGYCVGFLAMPQGVMADPGPWFPSPFETPAFGCLIGVLSACLVIAARTEVNK